MPLKSASRADATLRSAILQLLLLMLAAFGAVRPAQAQAVYQYANSTDSATNGITNTATPCTNRLTRNFTVSQSFAVADVNIGVLAAHSYRGDLVMYLVSPNGTRVQLTAGSNNNGANNFNAVFDDEAASAITSYTANDTATATTVVPPYNASYRPASALSAFDGQSANGTWTLEICDQYAQDSGTFYQSDLTLTAALTNYADLSLTKTVSNASPATGASISYTLTVTNASSSPDTASGVVVTDVLPVGTIYVGHSGTGTYSTSTGQWSVGGIAPGQSRSLTINVTVNASAGASVTNSAEITASSVVDSDSTPDNGITSEDDYAARSFTVSGTRTAGTAPSLSCPVGNTLFDWDARTWANGSTSNSYTVAGIGTVGFTIANPGAWLSNSTYGGQSPTRQNVVTGGYSPAQYSIMQLVNLGSANDSVVTTIALGSAVPGAQFRIFDVDYSASQFADRVTVTGSYNGAPVTPTLTNGVTNYVIGNSAYGDSTSSDGSAAGNVVVTFSSPVDTIVISYGNHSTAPNDPGQQAITLHDISFCNPQGAIGVTKASFVISDPVNNTTNPKAIPGAVIEYCITMTNTGTATLTSVTATDPIPAAITYIAGSMRSGTSCGAATTVEDDNNAGADESDPFGASITGTTITATVGTLASASAFAIKFQGTVN